MATESVLQAVQHYQRSIEKNSSDIARLLHCVGKLYKLPITVDHLQETGVGRTVNALRKHNGELGVAAEAVVNKWKEIVASESDRRANEQSSSEDDKESDNPNHPDENDDAEQEHRSKNTPTITEHHSHHKSEKPKNKHSTETNTTKHRSPSKHERHDRNKSDRAEKDRGSHKENHKKHHESKREEDNSSSSKKEKKDKSESSKHKRRRDDRDTANSDEVAEKERKEHKQKSSSREDGKKHSDEEKVNSDEAAVSTEKERKEHKHKSSSREDDKKHSDSSRHHHKSSSSGKHKSQDKHNADKESEKTKRKSHSSHQHSEKKSAMTDIQTQSLTSSPTNAIETNTNSSATSSSKRRHVDNVHNEKTPKKHKSETKRNNKHHTTAQDNEPADAEPDEDGIDSSMGANFADVLGMLNMTQKKAKKSLNQLKTSPTSAKKTTAAAENSSQTTISVRKLKNGRDFDGPSTSAQVNLDKKPNLLAPNVKLAPLDPSIALELPVISNNYKPMPLNPTVMDCVFNSSSSSSSRAPPRLLSDAEAYNHGISSKTIRTKVYSGIKSGQLFQVPSLFDLCIRVLQKNIDALEYTGGVPFDVLRPVLERATPQQLFIFEEYNPYLMEDSDVLWQQHVNRTYRAHKRQEMESWREMFMRCQEEQERRLNMLAQNIKQSQKVMAEPVRKTQLAFVDSMVKPPRSVMKKQEQYGTKSKLVATPAARVAALSSVTPNAAKTGDVRLRTAAAVKYDPAQVSFAPSRPKKAPLMAKTLQFIRGRKRR